MGGGGSLPHHHTGGADGLTPAAHTCYNLDRREMMMNEMRWRVGMWTAEQVGGEIVIRAAGLVVRLPLHAFANCETLEQVEAVVDAILRQRAEAAVAAR